MKQLIYNLNGNIYTDDDMALPNRAQQFGDGFFETMISVDGKLLHEELHQHRMAEAAHALELNLDNKDILSQLKSMISQVMNPSARIKLMVWRKKDDRVGYSSSTSESEYSITIIEREYKPERAIKIAGISEDIRLNSSAYSTVKTLSSLPYVLAAKERDRNQLDEIILIDVNGYLSECSSSNLFWKKDNKIYTPSLDTGCINGIMRRKILSQMPVQEVKVPLTELETADMIFCTNVAGLGIFSNWQDRSLRTDIPNQIKQLWAP